MTSHYFTEFCIHQFPIDHNFLQPSSSSYNDVTLSLAGGLNKNHFCEKADKAKTKLHTRRNIHTKGLILVPCRSLSVFQTFIIMLQSTKSMRDDIHFQLNGSLNLH